MKFPSLGIALLAGLGALAPKGMYFAKSTQMPLDAQSENPSGRWRRCSNKFPNPFTPPSGSGARERARRQRQWYGSVKF